MRIRIPRIALAAVLVAGVVAASAACSSRPPSDPVADFAGDVKANGFVLASSTDTENPWVETETEKTAQKAGGKAPAAPKAKSTAKGGSKTKATKKPAARTKTTTKSYIEALVVVRGCTVELQRNYNETHGAQAGGRMIEIYELDEAVGPGGSEIEIDDAPASPTVAQAEQYLRAHADKFGYCLR